MATQEPKTIAFVLYPGITLLDLVGPLQVFSVLRGFDDRYRPVVVASVCTGAMLLAGAGLLEGRAATTNWSHHRLLERLGATYRSQRWVEDGKVITSAGVSAGIDPQPPFGGIDWTRSTGTWPSRRSPSGSRPSWPTSPTCWPS